MTSLSSIPSLFKISKAIPRLTVLRGSLLKGTSGSSGWKLVVIYSRVRVQSCGSLHVRKFSSGWQLAIIQDYERNPDPVINPRSINRHPGAVDPVFADAATAHLHQTCRPRWVQDGDNDNLRKPPWTLWNFPLPTQRVSFGHHCSSPPVAPPRLFLPHVNTLLSPETAPDAP